MRGVHCVSQVRNVTMAQYEAFSVTDIHHCLVCVHCTVRHFDKFILHNKRKVSIANTCTQRLEKLTGSMLCTCRSTETCLNYTPSKTK